MFDEPFMVETETLADLLSLHNDYSLEIEVFADLYVFSNNPVFVPHMLFISYPTWGNRMKPDKRLPKLKVFFSYDKPKDNKDTITEVEMLVKFVKLALGKT